MLENINIFILLNNFLMDIIYDIITIVPKNQSHLLFDYLFDPTFKTLDFDPPLPTFLLDFIIVLPLKAIIKR